MTGFFYVDFLYDEVVKDVPLFSENKNFDIFIIIDHAMSSDEITNLKDSVQARFYEISIPREAELSAKKLLDSLLDDSPCDEQLESAFSVLKKLAEIYRSYHLVDLFYEYTLVLHQKMEYSFAMRACERLEQALGGIEQMIASMSDIVGKEYAVYAKYACQIMVNEYLIVQGRMERYDVGDLLKNIDGIYLYDEKFFKADYLKALAANQNSMYSAQPREMFANCIRNCPVNACKSYFYYCLGKWNEKHHRLKGASSSYRVSYRINPNNSKAAFKCAVEAKRKEEITTAKNFLTQIVKRWEDWTDLDQIPLHDAEYAYKVRMLLANLVDECFRAEWEENAKRFIKAMEPDKERSSQSFVKRLYADGDVQAVLNAMQCRIYLLHEINFFIQRRE